MEQFREKNWWERNWKWFVPIAVVSFFALLAIFIFLIMTFVFGLMKSSEPYKDAISIARSNYAVVEALGEPIEEGFFTSGNINISGSSGVADLAIPVTGPKGSAVIYLESRKSAGKWSYSTLVIEIKATRKRIDLLATPQASYFSPLEQPRLSLHRRNA